MFKKTRICLLIAALLVALTACGGKEDKESNKKDETTEETTASINLEGLYGSEIPDYTTQSGLVYPQSSVGDNEYLIYIKDTNEQECTAYADALAQAGLKLYSKKELSAGSGTPQKNTFYTYTGKDYQVFLSWYPTLAEVRIVMTPPGELPSLEKPAVSASDTFTLSLTQTGLTGGGMQYVIQTADGGFVIMDGGFYNDRDMLSLYDCLMAKVPEGQKPLIHMWMFSHGHQDHVELATAFMGKYANKIEIEAFCYNFPNLERMNTNGKEKDNLIVECTNKLLAAMNRSHPKAKQYLLHAGQTYYFKGLEIEITQTEEEVYPEVPPSWNYTSASWLVKFQNGEQAMFLADTSHQMSERLGVVYGDYLKSKYLQVAHHGLVGGNLQLYKNIDPAICLWPTDVQRFTGNWPDYKDQYSIGEGGCDYNAWIRDDSIRKREHYCHEATVSFEFK